MHRGGVHLDLLEAKGGLWQHRWTRSLHRIQQNVWSILATRIVWESQALPSLYPIAPPPTQTPPRGGGGVGTLGQIAPKRTDPPTHRPRTPRPPSPVGPPLSKGLTRTLTPW